MQILEEYRKQIESDVADSRRCLQPLEKGELRGYTRKSSHDDWVETTQDSIAYFKKLIALSEAQLARLERVH